MFQMLGKLISCCVTCLRHSVIILHGNFKFHHKLLNRFAFLLDDGTVLKKSIIDHFFNFDLFKVFNMYFVYMITINMVVDMARY
jgi:hypothetical protein